MLFRAARRPADDHWGPAPLQALIDAEAAAFAASRESAIISRGEPILLNPQAFSSMALVIHELVTNSTKYGSLSSDGVVQIDWSRNIKDDLVITWREIDGPPVAAPKRKGFGTTIVNRSVPYDLGGQAKIDYAVDGVQAEFTIPARHVSEPKSLKGPEIRISRPGVSSQQTIDPTHFGQRTVMLVEDSLIIALDAEDILDRFGATVLTASTPEAAHGILDQQLVDYAILDINLGDQTSFGVADRLKELGIPFFFASGYGEQANLPMDHRSMTVVQKPYTTHNIARGIDELFPDPH